MIFIETPLAGAYIIEMKPTVDRRGWFARTFCEEEFREHGLCAEFVQHNSSYNTLKGTVRGLHYQLPSCEEIKVVRCIRGRIFDVIVDLRQDSGTYLQWFSIELSEGSENMLYIPKGFAHGFQTLADDTEVFYLMSEFYRKGFEAGIRWDDEQLKIAWPIREQVTISDRDSALKTLNESLIG